MQGQTVKAETKVNIHWTNGMQNGMAYVMLGRSVRRQDIYISGKLDPSQIRCDPDALEESHWQGAQGISSGIRSHAALHNAGVKATQDNLWRDAERLFSEAIQRNPSEPLSWVARGLCRGELDLAEKAANDLAYAGALFEKEGDLPKAEQLREASKMFVTKDETSQAQGNGVGSAVLGGTLSTIQSLAPIALRALMPFLP